MEEVEGDRRATSVKVAGAVDRGGRSAVCVPERSERVEQRYGKRLDAGMDRVDPDLAEQAQPDSTGARALSAIASSSICSFASTSANDARKVETVRWRTANWTVECTGSSWYVPLNRCVAVAMCLLLDRRDAVRAAEPAQRRPSAR
jgi:hypothetical protein